jgi:hypothetical protein
MAHVIVVAVPEFYIVSSRLLFMDPISCVYDTQSKVIDGLYSPRI